MSEWVLRYDAYDPEDEPVREALCTLGNGYFATRGAGPESSADGIHYPGTYLAGGYNRATTNIADRDIENEDLVNLPNWLPLNFRIDDADWFSLDEVEVLEYHATLDLRQATLVRRVRVRDDAGRSTVVTARRFVSMADPHLAAQELTILPLDWSRRVHVRSGLDARVSNAGVERYRELTSEHLHTLEIGVVDDDMLFCKVETTQSELRVAQATRTQMLGRDGRAVDRRLVEEPDAVAIEWSIDVVEQEALTVQKTVALTSSRDHASHESVAALPLRRIDQARAAAKRAGFRGAMFPWQSGSDGREETQVVHLNPASGRWLPDGSHLQRHVNIAVAYNVWQYWKVTGDRDYLAAEGAQMLLEIAQFLSSLATYNRAMDRFEILGVMGPDEYHEGYPDRDEPGLDNNAYTNVMAVWVLMHALKVLQLLPVQRGQELRDQLRISREELDHWEAVSRKMRVLFHDGVISQFEGYEQLDEFDWEGYRREYGDIQRLDRILEAEGDTTDRYRLSKQADVLMLFYLLSDAELAELFDRLGYPFSSETVSKNVRYYLDRTSHGSTLSRVVHSWVLSRMDRRKSWEFFNHALQSDVADIQGGTTSEGIHLGAMAGTVDLVQRSFTGMVLTDDVIWFDPLLPREIQRLEMNVQYRQHIGMTIELTHDQLVIRSPVTTNGAAPVRVGFRGEVVTIENGTSREFDLTEGSAESP